MDFSTVNRHKAEERPERTACDYHTHRQQECSLPGSLMRIEMQRCGRDKHASHGGEELSCVMQSENDLIVSTVGPNEINPDDSVSTAF